MHETIHSGHLIVALLLWLHLLLLLWLLPPLQGNDEGKTAENIIFIALQKRGKGQGELWEGGGGLKREIRGRGGKGGGRGECWKGEALTSPIKM
jgi:hypothetical protein